MTRSEIVWRSLRDLGLASWFGGSVFGSVALPHPQAQVGEIDARSTVQSAQRDVETSAWKRWSPVVTASMAAHLIGGTGLLLGRRGRTPAQVEPLAVARTGLTLTAVALTVGAAVQGYRSDDGRGTGSDEQTDGSELLRRVRGERAMRAAGMLIPATTGALVVLDALEGEQRRRRDAARAAVDQALDAVRGATRRLPVPTRDLVGR